MKPVPQTCSGRRQKTTIGAADLLRLQRWNGYTDINSITTFAFPNMQTPCFLTEITVTWKDFTFVYKLTRHTDMNRGLRRLEEVIAFQCHSIFDHLKQKECGPCHAMVRLLDKEIEQLSKALPSDGAYQVMSSTHVMTVCNDIVSKIIYSLAEYKTLTDNVPMIPSCDDRLIKVQ